MKQYWKKISAKVDAMSKRERVLIFVSVAVLILSLVDTYLLEPQYLAQKELRNQVIQQTVSLAELQAKIITVEQDNSPNSSSPLRIQLNRAKQELDEDKAFLQSNHDHLVQPENMAAHLKQLLNRNNRLQLVTLQTLDVTPLIEETNTPDGEKSVISYSQLSDEVKNKQVFKHGVKLTVRGSYLDLINYLSELENLPQQMYWAKSEMKVVQYPVTELTLVLYTLSLDKTWLQI
jgi:MSHA biogenesis protein MshJ